MNDRNVNFEINYLFVKGEYLYDRNTRVPNVFINNFLLYILRHALWLRWFNFQTQSLKSIRSFSVDTGVICRRFDWIYDIIYQRYILQLQLHISHAAFIFFFSLPDLSNYPPPCTFRSAYNLFFSKYLFLEISSGSRRPGLCCLKITLYWIIREIHFPHLSYTWDSLEIGPRDIFEQVGVWKRGLKPPNIFLWSQFSR